MAAAAADEAHVANGDCRSPLRPLSTTNIKSFVDSVEVFLFDCDGLEVEMVRKEWTTDAAPHIHEMGGRCWKARVRSQAEHDLILNRSPWHFEGVIWKGDKLIDGVEDALNALRMMGKRLVFVTNNSTKSRRQYAKKFSSLGLTVGEDEIFSSSFAAAMYLGLINFPKEKNVYVVGEEGILEELQLAGFHGLGGPEDGKKTVQLKSDFLFEHDKNVGAVIVGLDPNINYYKLQYATLCIRENPGCLFIATNRDAFGHMTDLQEWPGAGAMVGAICGSTQREPVVVGKPAHFLMDFLLERFQLPTSKMCMVGDRLDTDILFGRDAGCPTLLVLSGVTSLSTLQDPSNNIRPDYYTNKVPDIIDLLRS